MRYGQGAQFGRAVSGAAPPPPPPPPSSLLTNGDFSAGTTGWSFYPQVAFGGGAGSLAEVGGKGRVSSPGSFASFGQTFPTTVGATYAVTADATNIDAALWFVRKSDDDQVGVNVVAIVANVSGAGQAATFVATAAATFLTIQSNGGSADFDNLSVTLA